MTRILADVVWPALFLEARVFSWWAIGIGLLIELFFVRYLTKLGWPKCVLADVTMNAASSLLGVFLIPAAGIGWEIFPGSLIQATFNVGTFNPATWAGTFILAVVINAVLESSILRFVFKQPGFKRLFWWLCVANALSVAVAFGSLWIYPPRDF